MRVRVVGQLTRDCILKEPEQKGVFRLGGAALFAGLAFRKEGWEVRIWSAGKRNWIAQILDFGLQGEVLVGGGAEFVNRYAEIRRQEVRAKGRPLPMPPRERFLVLAPVLEEVPWRAVCRGQRVAVLLQGWLREIRDGTVRPRIPRELGRRLSGVEAVFYSHEDAPCELREQMRQVPIVVHTHAEEGGEIWVEGERHIYRALRVPATDATGAGDVFAGTFLAVFWKTGNWKRALDAAIQRSAEHVQAPYLEALV